MALHSLSLKARQYPWMAIDVPQLKTTTSHLTRRERAAVWRLKRKRTAVQSYEEEALKHEASSKWQCNHRPCSEVLSSQPPVGSEMATGQRNTTSIVVNEVRQSG